jgi:hypothetical protein
MTRVFVSIEQTPAQADTLMSQFIKSRRGETHSAMSIMQLCTKVWGIRYDWHDWAAVFVTMYGNMEVEIIGNDMDLTQYWIK